LRMKIQSKALEVNIADYHVDVTIDDKYLVLQDVMAPYPGMLDSLNNLLIELSHPYKNWHFIVQNNRKFALDYLQLLFKHPKGNVAAGLYIEIFLEAMMDTSRMDVRVDAIDNMLLFLIKIVREAGLHISKFLNVLNHTFNKISKLDDERFMGLIKSFYPIPRLGHAFYSVTAVENFSTAALNSLLIRYFSVSYQYWLNEEDPQIWFKHEAGEMYDPNLCNGIFTSISHQSIRALNNRLIEITQMGQEDVSTERARQMTEALLTLASYNQIVDIYAQTPMRLQKAVDNITKRNQWKLIFLFHIMNTSGLSIIHEQALKEINRTLSWLIGNEEIYNIRRLIQKTFSILKQRTNRYPITALNCVLNMGGGVYQTDDSDLVNYFIESVIELGFQYPSISGVGNDWQIKMNRAHIQNIRTWMQLIEIQPKWSTRLLSALIINLTLAGVFLKDTDLFPRDITRFLNCGIEPVYNLTKQLTRLFPTYFNDIGAEGQLRDISTQLDEITSRKDILIHFLRKQSHVESSNRIIGFIEATLTFWASRQKEYLLPYLPPKLYKEIQTTGVYVNGVHQAMTHLKHKGLDIPQDLLLISASKLLGLFKDFSGASKTDLERVHLAVKLYHLLHQKYNLSFIDLDQYIRRLRTDAFPEIDKLQEALVEKRPMSKLFMLMDYLDQLKKLILAKKEYEVREDIFKKRHFTVDIPSMYGSYHEMKFDAMGLTLRIETLISVLFEEIVREIDLSLITKATFYQIYDRLLLFDKMLRLEGISSQEFERQLDVLAHSLEVKGFTFTQYLDIFKGFATAVKNIINDYFANTHELNLSKVLSQIPLNQILPTFMPLAEGIKDEDEYHHRVSEIFFRELIASTPGLQQLDFFLSRILNTLFHQSDKLPKEKLQILLNYDPDRAMTSITQSSSKTSGIIYMGNKGFNMAKLTNFGMPVPAGFVITTEVYRCREIIEGYSPAEQNFKDQVAEQIAKLEEVTKKSFGNPENPLLFSVRSGASISQPGMMDTFLDVGINAGIVAGIARKTGNEWFAWDNYRRFLQCFGMTSGLARDDFDAIIREYKRKWDIPLKKGFTGKQMREVALAYKTCIVDSGVWVLEDPFEQLYATIKYVFESWNSDKAQTYRKIMGISDDWGTAVTVQEMVYGNISQQSGTGVIFTHNPHWSEDKIRLWGDFTVENQGEDVVAGLVTTLPISVIQQDFEMRETDITLETHYPEIYQALQEIAEDLIYNKGWSPQEMEFTFESPAKEDLYLLQTRDMAIRQRKKVMTFDLPNENNAQYLGHGIGVSGGAMSGRVVFSLKEIDEWRKREPETSLILLRSDTVPDDIREIYAADGLLTARGGLTSHAAVMAHRLGKTCIVGCANLNCDENLGRCTITKVHLTSGDYLSIDGQQGSVYQGLLKVKER
jgi:pyruvate,orthophosphate dikinase